MFLRSMFGIAAFCFALDPAMAFANYDWLYGASGSSIDEEDAWQRIANADVVVLGETHYEPAIHRAQGEVIAFLANVQTDSELVVGWEFLNLVDGELIASTWEQLPESSQPAEQFLGVLFPDDQSALAYAPMVEATYDAGLSLVPTNLTRPQKKPVVEGGIAAAEPGVVPEGFALGSDGYYARFVDVMGGHPLPHPVDNYYAAQCLTDDVLADSLLSYGETDAQRVLVVGSFHGDFRDGVVQRLEARAPESTVLYVRMVLRGEMSADDLAAFVWDDTWGARADLVLVID